MFIFLLLLYVGAENYENSEKYGFLYRGLKKRFLLFRWSVFPLSLALALQNTFFPTPSVQLFIGCLIFIVYVLVVATLWPFKNWYNNASYLVVGTFFFVCRVCLTHCEQLQFLQIRFSRYRLLRCLHIVSEYIVFCTHTLVSQNIVSDVIHTTLCWANSHCTTQWKVRSKSFLGFPPVRETVIRQYDVLAILAHNAGVFCHHRSIFVRSQSLCMEPFRSRDCDGTITMACQNKNGRSKLAVIY